MINKTGRVILYSTLLILLANAAGEQTAAGTARSAPHAGHVRFVLMIDGQPAARFTGVQGLQPGKRGSITLTRGSSLNPDLLKTWQQSGSGKKPPASVMLLSLGANNEVLERYQLVSARPKTISPTLMKPGGNAGSSGELTVN